MNPGLDPASVESFEIAVLRALNDEWHSINYNSFHECMRAPILALTDATSHLARWRRADRHLEVARTLVTSSPWGVVVEVLKHEMAHQFVDEVLRRHDEAAHGPAFRQVCADRGIDADASGRPEASGEDARIISKVEKLLALATSSNQHEAEAAMAKARQLMLEHNVQAISARAPRKFGCRQLGPTKRVHEHFRVLAMILVDHFFVEGLWLRNFDVERLEHVQALEICGTPENLAIAEYVHGFMVGTAERLWLEHKRTHPRAGRRLEYLAGVMRGFKEKLKVQSKNDSDRGLVWVRDGDLVRYFDCRHPRVRTIARRGNTRSETYAAGRAAGANVVLHRAVDTGPVARGHLLPAGHR